MAGEEKHGNERRRVSIGSTVFTSALTVLAAVVIFFVINSFGPNRDNSEFRGLISPDDGRMLIPRDPNLKIESIVFDDFDKHEVPVDIEENPGHKVNAFVIREKDNIKEVDMLKTLSADSIKVPDLPEVPQLIEVHVSDTERRGKVSLYIITDRPYPASPRTHQVGLPEDQTSYELQVGRRGLTGFIRAEAGGVYTPGANSGVVGLGEGPIGALLAIRFHGNKPVGRSQLLLIKRKGIVHPGDKWYDENRSGYFSRPFVGNDFSSCRLAFITPIEGGPPKLIVSTLDYKQHFDVSALFPEGEVTIDHWGKDAADYDILYVKELYGDQAVEKVRVGMLDAARFMEELNLPPPVPEETAPEQAPGEKGEPSPAPSPATPEPSPPGENPSGE